MPIPANINDLSVTEIANSPQGTESAKGSIDGYLRAHAGFIATTRDGVSSLQTKSLDTLTIIDAITSATERAAILAGTSTMNHTAIVQAAINAAGTRQLVWLGTVNCGPLTSAASVNWVGYAGAKIKLIPAVYGLGNYHVMLTGPRVRVDNIDFDGNQDNMTVAQGCLGLQVSGASPTILNIRTHDYNGRGYDCYSANIGVKHGLHIGCGFDDNAGSGMEMIAASYHHFLGCTFDRNGYGFQKSRSDYGDISHSFVGFGFAVRMRSHHITFSACHARDNGRDGMNVNQGSYAIKFAQCLAYGNDDGGFTIASDNTGSGLPGEAEACYDLEYIGCEAYNNYSSGLVAYQAAHNVIVTGGGYYNNHRLAGDVATAASYYNGIYFASGSSGVFVDATTYDNRQSRVITGNASGVLSATGWVTGSKNYYPKVAIYAGADQTFRGYGEITAESSDSVTIAPSAFNAVTLGSIIAGDYVTQAVQHNGVFADNNCQGVISTNGAGHRVGVSAGSTGQLINSGGFSGGQNICLPKARQGSTELLQNPSFDTNISNWGFSVPGGGSQTHYTGALRRSAGALQLIGGSSPAVGDGFLIADYLQCANNEFIEFGGLVHTLTRGGATLQFFWTIGGSTFSTTVNHPGGGWRFLRIGIRVPDTATALTARVGVGAGKTGIFDSLSFRVIDSSIDDREFSLQSRYLAV